MKAEIYRLFPQFFESSKNLLNNIGKNVKINVCTKKTGGFFSLHNKYYVMLHLFRMSEIASPAPNKRSLDVTAHSSFPSCYWKFELSMDIDG